MAKKRKIRDNAERETQPLEAASKAVTEAAAAEDEILPDAEEKPQISPETTESVPAASEYAPATAVDDDGGAAAKDAVAAGDGVGDALPGVVAPAATSDGDVAPEAAVASINGGGDAVPEATADTASGGGGDGEAAPEATATGDGVVDDEPEPVQNLLEPLSKEQLIDLLCEAADRHADVMDKIHRIADEDPVHRKIFVHGLGWDTNAPTLASFFSQYGEIEDLNVVCDKISGKSKGYGFILFKHRAGARRSLKQPQKKIGNRLTACQMASLGPVPPPAPLATEYTQRKIYVSNVSADLDPQKLLQFFSKYGDIEEGPLGLDKQTGKPKGFTLFVYRTADGAKKALEEPHKNFEGHILHCQKAIDGPKSNKPGFHMFSSGAQLHHGLHHGPAAGSGAQRPHFTRGETAKFGHLMAPSGGGSGFNQGGAPGAAAAAGLNPALGQALASLLTTSGAGIGLTNLLGSLGATGMASPVPNQGVPAPAVNSGLHGMQSAYGNPPAGGAGSVNSGLLGAYGVQAPMPQGAGRGQKFAGHKGGAAPYGGH